MAATVPSRCQQRAALITAKRNEVQVLSARVAFQVLRREPPDASPPFAKGKTAKGRPPGVVPSYHSVVKYDSGMLASCPTVKNKIGTQTMTHPPRPDFFAPMH